MAVSNPHLFKLIPIQHTNLLNIITYRDIEDIYHPPSLPSCSSVVGYIAIEASARDRMKKMKYTEIGYVHSFHRLPP
jgi:hypothetical protein